MTRPMRLPRRSRDRVRIWPTLTQEQFRKTAAHQLYGEGKPCFLRLAGDRHGYDGAGSLVEDVVAYNENRTSPCLLPTLCRVELCPEHITPQYSGHDSRS